ncbi:hypothetical protein ACJMK2_029686 [Sinanodonta woodiana]|uniref:SUEL-type lectin domain-containing protein n=1 Tax=Sinanodonta woodiana TaxID=1069815 RepID=A0ABD3XAX3_SINWO
MILDKMFLYVCSVSCIVILLETVTRCRGVGIQTIYSSGCNNERIFLECPDLHKIAIKRLFYGVKQDRQCANQGRKHSMDCCQARHNDCLVVDDEKYPFLNMLCSGHRRCDIEAKSIETGVSCQDTGYKYTDFMTVIHDCIPDHDIVYLCSDTHKRGKALYLSNRDYPHAIGGGKKQCQCVIKTGSTIGLDMHALDILITRSTKGIDCFQEISIQDNLGYRKVITCGHEGLYGFRTIYRRDVQNVTLSFKKDSDETGGYIWLQTKASDNSDYVDIYCGATIKQLSNYNPEKDSKSRVVVEGSEDDVTVAGVISNHSSTAKIVSDQVAIIAGVAVAAAQVVIIGLTGIIILCVRRFRQRKQANLRQATFPTPSPMLKSKNKKEDSISYCKYDYDEDKFCSIKRSPMRVSKFSDSEFTPEQDLKEAFLQGVAQSDTSDVPNGGIKHQHSLSSPNVTLTLEETEKGDSSPRKPEAIVHPKSEYLEMTSPRTPRPVIRDIRAATLPEKRKVSKTVTFSPIAMVSPLPSGSEESVPEDKCFSEDLKGNFQENYSKSLPFRANNTSRILPPSETTTKVHIVPSSLEDSYVTTFHSPDLANVTEEDLWKAFHITLEPETKCTEDNYLRVPLCSNNVNNANQINDDCIDDENPYDNIPYMNTGSLRRNELNNRINL